MKQTRANEKIARERAAQRRYQSSARRHGLAQRIFARVLLVTLIANPAYAKTVNTELGKVDFQKGTTHVSINTQVHTQFSQNVQNSVLRFHNDIQQPGYHLLDFQQNANDSVLIQMPGHVAANFWGRIQAQGTVVIANGAGVYFQDGSFVDVGALVAVGSNVSRDNFVDGLLNDIDLTGPVEFWGTLSADSALLAGTTVANHGDLVLREGSLLMYSGDRLSQRDEYGNPIVVVANIPSGNGPATPSDEPAILNTGTIQAQNGSVRMAAGDLLSFAIRNTGTIQAQEISLDGGDQGLVEVSGHLDASNLQPGGVGGRIEVLGDTVAIIGHAVLDASGESGGGEILVGGDRAGQGDVRTATNTYVGSDTTLRADATGDGDGGKIIVWADETSLVYGNILARGGKLGGNGGFAETSGKKFLDIGNILPDLRARSGKQGDYGGEWLLDPMNIDIVDAGACIAAGTKCMGDDTEEPPDWNPDLEFSAFLKPTENSSLINVDVLIAALSRGTSVTLSTESASGSPGTEDGNITFLTEMIFEESDVLQPNTESTFTLLAANDINVDHEIINGASNLILDLAFRANDTPQSNGQGQQENGNDPNEFAQEFLGDINIRADIFTGGGNVDLSGANVIFESGTTVETQGGSVNADAIGGDILLGGDIDTRSYSEDRIGGSVLLAAQSMVHAVTSSSTENDIFGGNVDVVGDIKTDGNNVTISATSGDVEVTGMIDTRLVQEYDVDTEEVDIKIFDDGKSNGGHVSIQSGSQRRPNTKDIYGGNIRMAGDVFTGGGNIGLGCDADLPCTFASTLANSITTGVISIESTLDTSGGLNRGGIQILSDALTFGPEGDDENSVIAAGSIHLEREGKLKTGGGSVVLSSVNIRVHGEIDTIRDVPLSDDPNQSEIGGNIAITGRSFTASGFESSIVIEDLRKNPNNAAQITSDGGDVIISTDPGSFGAGRFVMHNSSIDARALPGSSYTETPGFEDDNFESTLEISGFDRIEISNSGQSTPQSQLLADELVVISNTSANGASSGRGITFATSGGAQQIEIAANQVRLSAGNGFGGGSSQARVDGLENIRVAGKKLYAGAGYEAMSNFSLRQDASIFTGDFDIKKLFDETMDFSGLKYQLESVDGIVQVDKAADLEIGSNSAGVEVILSAATNIKIEEKLGSLEYLGLQITQDFSFVDPDDRFKIDTALADNISGVANHLVISTVGDLEVEGDSSGSLRANEKLEIFSGAEITVKGDLEATEELLVHSGSLQKGDIVFDGGGSDILLTSNDITLWAGDGVTNRGSSIDASSGVAFANDGVVSEPRFQLRMDTDIVVGGAAGNVPGQFSSNPGQIFDYTLRSDFGSITVVDPDQIADHRLSLHALDGIHFDFDDTQRLKAVDFDLGGLENFTFTQSMNDLLEFTNEPGKLILRAGIARDGVLSFEDDMPDDGDEFDVIVANEVRLVAGDGLGSRTNSFIACGTGSGACPNFRFDTTRGESIFVFRQDAPITLGALPNLDSGNLPDQYVIRSDSGGILIDASSQFSIPEAANKLTLSAISIEFDSRTGDDLILDDFFGATTELLFETNDLRISVQGGANSEAKFVAGNNVSVTGFELDETLSDAATMAPDDTPWVPDEYEIGRFVEKTPDVVFISQDGSFEIADLFDLDKFGRREIDSGDDPQIWDYSLISNNGSIEVTPDSLKPLFDSDGDLSSLVNILLEADDDIILTSTDGGSFVVNEFGARTEGDLVIENSVVDMELVIDAKSVINFQAGASGRGDLSFGENVWLQSRQISLQAGVQGAAPITNNLNVVDARTNMPTFVLIAPTDDEESPWITNLIVQQDGSFVSPNSSVSSRDESQIVGMDQIIVRDEDGNTNDSSGNPYRLDALAFISEFGDITLEDFSNIFASEDASPRNLTLLAGSLIEPYQNNPSDGFFDSSRKITLGSTNAAENLDLTIFDLGFMQSSQIELVAPDGGVVLAQSDGMIFITKEFQVSYHGNDLSDGVCDNAGNQGCLPNPTQFAESLAETRYDLNVTGGDLLLNHSMAYKVHNTNLFLDATGRVVINANNDAFTGRYHDLMLNSLVIGSVNNPMSISFGSEGNSPGDKGATRIFTTDNQTYYGDIVLEENTDPDSEEGTYETQGQIVHFAGNVTTSGDDKQAHLSTNVGEKLQIDGDMNFGAVEDDGFTSGFSVRFQQGGGNTPFAEFRNNTTTAPLAGSTPGTQTVRGEEIEFVAVSDLSAPNDVASRNLVSASIFKADDNLTFEAENFRTGRGERIAVAADFLIEGIDGERADVVSVGDISALEMRIRSERLELIRRDKGSYLGQDGQLHDDDGVDYVANSIYFDAGEIVEVGDGNDPVFGVQAPVNMASNLRKYATAAISADGSGITRASFFSDALPGRLLDLHPDGPSVADASNIRFGSEIVPPPGPWVPDGMLPASLGALQSLDIDPRLSTEREIRGRMNHGLIIDDVGQGAGESWVRTSMSEERILARDAQAAANLHVQIFGLDNSRAPEIQEVLSEALERYRNISGARRVLGFEFRRYVRNRPNSEFDAFELLEGLDRLFEYHRHLGVTPGEYRPIQFRWLASIKPEGISLEELAQAIHPSRFVRGSDILDIFGE